MKKLLLIGLSLVLCLLAWVGWDLWQNAQIPVTKAKDNYSKELGRKASRTDDVMAALERGERPDFAPLHSAFEYLGRRYDTADFRLPSLVRILYSHHDKLPKPTAQSMQHALTSFKYWMDQPGADSMCYWSENHQILFASGEYLVGHFYADELFSNAQLTGREHQALGKRRVLTWLEQRFLYGFSEWYSSTYYVEDIAPLSVLIDFAPDEEVRIKAAMVLDLLLYDIASQHFNGTFTASSGRMYDSARMSGRYGSMKEVIAHIWPEYAAGLKVTDVRGVDANFRYIKNYQVPAVIKAIGEDKSPQIIKASNGLNLSELAAENLVGPQESQIMMQFAAEAFSQPEVVQNSLQYINKHQLLSNEFLADFKQLNVGLLKHLKLTPWLMKTLNPAFNGTALQRANTYMYRTEHFAMSTTQAYHPGSYGDQHSLFSLVLNNDVNIFTQHPAKALSDSGALGKSPNYWVGYGYLPHTVQEKNINLAIWQLPEKPNPLSTLLGLNSEIEPFTHAYLPQQYFDEVSVSGNYAFAKLGRVYIALIGKNPLTYKALNNSELEQRKGLNQPYDLIQQGRETFWITEVGLQENFASFEEFQQAIKQLPVNYENNRLNYRDLALSYQGSFSINEEIQNLEYQRFDAPYSQQQRQAKVIEFAFGGDKLTLDFYGLKRSY